MRMTLDDVNGKMVERWHVVGILSAGPTNCTDKATQSIFTEVSEFQEWITDIIDKDLELSTMSGKYCAINNKLQCGSCSLGYKLNDDGSCKKINLALTLDHYKRDIDEFVCPEVCLERAVCQKNEGQGYEPVYTECKCDNGRALEQCTSSTDDSCEPHGCNVDHYYDTDDRSCKAAVLPRLDFEVDTKSKAASSALIATPIIKGEGYNNRHVFAEDNDLQLIAEKMCDYYAEGKKSDNSTG